MDFSSNLSAKDLPNPTSHNDSNSDQLQPTKSDDLLHSAKVVADAAKAHLRHEPEKFDKTAVAGAATELLNAAAECGNLDDQKGIGKYVAKAEDCLRHYNDSHPTGGAGN